MKVNISIECTPEEMKKMLNLPDLSKIIEGQVKAQFKLPSIGDIGVGKNYYTDMFPWMNTKI